MEELKTIKKTQENTILNNNINNTYSQVNTYINFDDFDVVEEIKQEKPIITNNNVLNTVKNENQFTKKNIESITGIEIDNK